MKASYRSDRRLWLVMGVLALFLLWSALGDARGDWSWIAGIGFALYVLSLIGQIAGWGPTLPCMLFGMMIALWAGATSSSPEEAAFHAFGAPAIGGMVGAYVGWMWEKVREANSATLKAGGDETRPD